MSTCTCGNCTCGSLQIEKTINDVKREVEETQGG